MASNLNRIYDYRLRRSVRYSNNCINVLRIYKIYSQEAWADHHYDDVKIEIKRAYYFPQNRRCAYCRKKLNADAYYNHIDHVLPKSIYYRWMFKPKNLVIACELCNFLKNDEDTLLLTHSECKFPKCRNGFTIFNPHLDRWSDFFEIEDGIFIRGKHAKANETIRICKLSQYHFSVQFAEEARVTPKSAIKRATTKQRLYAITSTEYQSCQKVIEYYTNLI